MQAPCIECESDEIRVDVREGTIVCMNCGRVNQHGLIDETYESRNFSKDFTSKGGDSGKRIGGANNYLLDNGGLGTQMGGINMGDGRFPAYANRFYNSGPGKSLD